MSPPTGHDARGLVVSEAPFADLGDLEAAAEGEHLGRKVSVSIVTVTAGFARSA